jgi:hypothetical protein
MMRAQQPRKARYTTQDPKSIIYLLYFKISKVRPKQHIVRPKQRIYIRAEIVESQESAVYKQQALDNFKTIGKVISTKCPNVQSLLNLCTHFTTFVSCSLLPKYTQTPCDC